MASRSSSEATKSPFPRRLRAARKRAGLTQEQAAAKAGIDEYSASARMSQYETGKHVPHFETVKRFAAALGVPTEYFYTVDERTAEFLLLWHGLSSVRRGELLALLSRQSG